jgi:hypothetical protein
MIGEPPGVYRVSTQGGKRGARAWEPLGRLAAAGSVIFDQRRPAARPLGLLKLPELAGPTGHGILGHVLAGRLVAGIAVKGAT